MSLPTPEQAQLQKLADEEVRAVGPLESIEPGEVGRAAGEIDAWTLPFSLLMEKLVGQVPWILNSPIALLSIVTGLGAFQTALLWLFAVWRNPFA